MRALMLSMLLVAAPLLAEPAAPQLPAQASVAEARTCLFVSQIRETKVVDGQTIDFRLRDGSVWRNRLPLRCPGLNYERAFSYTTSISQLCNVDIIRIIVQGNSSLVGMSCGLGKFERLPPKPPRDP